MKIYQHLHYQINSNYKKNVGLLSINFLKHFLSFSHQIFIIKTFILTHVYLSIYYGLIKSLDSSDVIIVQPQQLSDSRWEKKMMILLSLSALHFIHFHVFHE